MESAVIAFLSDYGLADDFVGVCHGVIARGCPGARVIDLTHGIQRHDVRAGALTLARALPYLPAKAIALAVVDPGVGGPRRGVAVRCADGRRLVGPDNGLLWPAAQAAGGAEAVVDLGASPLALAPVSATFHGRDVFAPVAAALAAETPLERVGEPAAASLQALAMPSPRREGEVLFVHVVSIDSFGNLQLDAGSGDLPADTPGGAVTVTAGGRPCAVRTGRTFSDVAPGELLLYRDAYGIPALAVNRGSAAERLGAGVDAELSIAPVR